MTAPLSLDQKLADLEHHPGLSDDDRIILNPGFKARRMHEVIKLPELVVSHVERLHGRLVAHQETV